MNDELIGYWRNIWTVQFELSHKCPNLGKHCRCPITELSQEFDGYLPAAKIFEICQSMKDSGNYWATIMFHLYNEPTSDCRLAWFVDTIRNKMGMKNQIKLHSSTVNMDKTMIEDLITCGVNHFTFTISEEPTFAVFNEYREHFMVKYPDVRFRIYMARYDNRMNIYKGEPLDMGLLEEHQCQIS